MFVKGIESDAEERKTECNNVIKETMRRIKGECVKHLGMQKPQGELEGFTHTVFMWVLLHSLGETYGSAGVQMLKG